MATTPKGKSTETDEPAKAGAPGVRIPLHDPVPTLFADGCHGANVISGCVRLDLYAEHAWQGSKGNQQMVVGRVVVPLERFRMFVQGMNAIFQKLEEEKAAKGARKA